MIPLEVRLSPSPGLAKWGERYNLGEVPDRSPYGLHRLSRHGFAPRFVHSVDDRRPMRLVSRVLGGAGASWQVGTSETPMLYWDERMLLSSNFQRNAWAPYVSGCIWATEPDAGKLVRAMAGRGLRRAAGVFVNSPRQLVALRGLGVSDDRSAYIPFGVDTTWWGRCVRRPPQDAGYIVAVGTDRHRDFEGLLTAARDVYDRCSTSLRLATARALVTPPQVELGPASHRELRDEIYAQARVAVVATASNLHASGLTASLEAMAAGVPLVVTRGGGLEAYVDDGRTGLVVEQGDRVGLAAAIIRLLEDRALAARLASAAKADAQTRFSSSGFVSRLSDFLARINFAH